MRCYLLLLFGISCFWLTHGSDNALKPISPTLQQPEDIIRETAEILEQAVKSFIKSAVRNVIARIISRGQNLPISAGCTKAYMRFMSDLMRVKLWAMKMVDATSKLPAGVLEGTFTDYGSFDECLEIVVPLKNGSEDFRGRYCAAEVSPLLPPVLRNYSFARQLPENPFDTLGKQFVKSSSNLHYLKFRFGVCIPSACSIDDLRGIFPGVLNVTFLNVHVSKCYVKEDIKFDAIHIVVICVIGALLVFATAGTILENLNKESETIGSGLRRFLLAFSLLTNSKRLTVTAKANGELRPVHAIRAMSMAWVILGHTYVWTSVSRSRRPLNSQIWFNSPEFEVILNAWLSVDMFFFISGLLTCYIVLRVMEKTKDPFSVLKVIVHRYIRLTPPLLMTMGLLFFLPLIASGPFWHERVDSELEACRNKWWPNLLYIANTMSMDDICIHTMWYLSADFQMFVITVIVLFVFRRSPFFGMVALGVLAVACHVVVFALTYIYELPPAILVSTGNMQLINEEIDMIHLRTYSHAGPYYVGLVSGYLILKRKKSFQLTKWQNTVGWSTSFFLSVTSLYGVHRWNTGYFHGPLLSSLYAAMHRSTFTLGVAWVTIACITGNGGPVNWILSRKLWVFFSKLTYMVYLLHGLVLWTRFGYIRERFYLSHYNMVYEFIPNVVTVVVLSIPFYLLVEAPMDNLERMIFPRPRCPTESVEKKDLNHEKGIFSHPSSHSDMPSRTVELTSIRTLSAGGYKNGFSQFAASGTRKQTNVYH